MPVAYLHMYGALVFIFTLISSKDSSSEFMLPEGILQVSQNLHFVSSVIGELSIIGYARQASGLSSYILHLYPPWGDRSLLSVSRNGHVLPLGSIPIS